MNNSYDFRVGFQSFQLMPPSGTPKGLESFRWTMEECERLGARATSLFPHMIPDDLTPGVLSEMAAIAREKDVKILIYPFTVWGLAGLPLKCDSWGPFGAAVKANGPDDIPHTAAARAGVEKMIKIAEALGSDILCGGYGHVNVATSRYNKEYPYSEQRKFVIANLKELARILEGTGIIFAYENHCDFTGKEIASIIEDVGSDNIKALYDFGNAAVICADPMEDVDYLAPYAVAAHFKDFKVINNPHRTKEYPCVPMCVTGCYLGEGFIDFDVILQAIIDKAPNPRGMCLLAEPAYQLPTNDEEKNDRVEFNRRITRQYAAKMLEIVQKF
jgi:sugar phosphate isomerase/epimerase